MRVVVAGLVATYPVGGVAWDYLQYVQGFHALGCEVWYVEDTGRWLYDPQRETFVADATRGARFVGGSLAWLDPALARRWAVRAPDGKWHGLDEQAVARAFSGADLFLNVSGACWLREAYRDARVKAYLDSDPGYTQGRLAAVDAGTADEDTVFSADLVRRHDVFFTLGERIGAPDCLIPSCGIRWYPTRQPIVLADWPVRAAPDGAFTTVMSWKIEPTPPELAGRAFGGKDVEFERFLDLPRHVPERLEVALSGAAPRDRILAAGWRLVSSRSASGTMAAYRDYIAASRGEWSIAKNAYVATRSGWFSTRSAAYLACGKPVVVQDTGFAADLERGPGLRPFSTMAEAAAALAAVRTDYGRACEHARMLAERSFAAERVLGRLLADAGVA
jgi:hypothetical protein